MSVTNNQRIEGRVVSAPGALLYATFALGDKKETRRAPQAFEVETAAGTVRVETTSDTFFLPLEERNGPWGKLADEPGAAPFQASAPAPHERVKLGWMQLAPGDLVVVEGAVAEMAFDAAAAPRAAAQARPAVITARVLARGPEANDLVEKWLAKRLRRRGTRQVPSLRLPTMVVFFLAMSVPAFAWAFLTAHAPLRADCVIVGATLLMAGLWIHRLSRGRLVFFSDDGKPVDGGLPASGMVKAMTLVSIVLFSMAMVSDVRGGELDGKPMCVAPFIATMNAAIWAVALLNALISEWKASRLAAVLLAAPPQAAGGKPGAWGRVEGEVVARQERALVSIFEDEYREGSSPNVQAYRGSVSPFTVRVGDGSSVPVAPQGILWGAATVEESDGTATSARRSVQLAERSLKSGGRAAVVGRVRSDGALAATSPESLVAYAVDSGSPLAALRRALWSGRAFRGFLLLGLVLLILFAQFHPGVPDLNMPSSD